MEFNNEKIFFFEINDFDGNVLKKHNKGKWFVMIQASYCHWCTEAKPELIRASKSDKLVGKKIAFANIHVDSNDPDTAGIAKDIRTIFGQDVSGIPSFFLYDASTHKSIKYKGKNKAQDFVDFLNQNL